MNIILEQLLNIRPQLFMQLGFWELSADQGVEGACAKEPEPEASQEQDEGRFSSLPLLTGTGGLLLSGKIAV